MRLVLFWAQDAEIGPRTINARAETIHYNTGISEAIKYCRCFVPAMLSVNGRSGSQMAPLSRLSPIISSKSVFQMCLTT